MVGVLLAPMACSQKAVDVNDPATREQLSLLMPASVNIVGPFTRFCSFDHDGPFEGIELLLQPINSFGDPVNIAGGLIVELYAFQKASGDNRGAKLEQWDIVIATERDQREYWNRTTSMYEFQLEFNTVSLAPGEKYVLEVIYNTPLGEHMLDDHVLEVPIAATATADAG
jgi:hypothetical protein